LTRNYSDKLSHGVAGLIALIYIWCISITDLRQTGLQFVTPLLVVFLVQTVWCLIEFGVTKNIYIRISQRTLNTNLLLFFVVLLAAILIPESAHGNLFDNLVGSIFTILYCLFVIIVFGAIVSLIGLIIGYGLRSIYRLVKPKSGEKNEKDDVNDINEIGSIILTIIVLTAASLEGLNNTFSFSTSTSSTASQLIEASKDEVWKTLETATRPEFPLPSFLALLPRPVDVVVDEGVALHANRVVKFQGREGEGYLRLRVVEKTHEHARFKVMSDTGPAADWIAHRTLTYHVTTEGLATRLTVTLEYDRLLSPAWFFNILMGGTTYMAMDVLARDVKNRSQIRG